MFGAAFVTGIELRFPNPERSEGSPAFLRRTLVDDVVRKPAESVSGVDSTSFPARKKSESHRKISTVLMRNLAAKHVCRINSRHTTGPKGGTFISVSRERHQCSPGL